MKRLFLTVVMCIFTTLISNAQTESQGFINPHTGKPYSANRTASISDIPPYYREAAIQGRWNLLDPPRDMAMQAYLDQKKEGGVWGVAFRDMFTKNSSNDDLPQLIPQYGAKRTIIYQNPANVKDSAYWAQQLADFGISGIIISLLVGGLIFLVGWKMFLTEKSKENRRVVGRILKRIVVVLLILFTFLLIVGTIMTVCVEDEIRGLIPSLFIISILVLVIVLLLKKPKKNKTIIKEQG